MQIQGTAVKTNSQKKKKKKKQPMSHAHKTTFLQEQTSKQGVWVLKTSKILYEMYLQLWGPEIITCNLIRQETTLYCSCWLNECGTHLHHKWLCSNLPILNFKCFIYKIYFFHTGKLLWRPHQSDIKSQQQWPSSNLYQRGPHSYHVSTYSCCSSRLHGGAIRET